MMTMQSSAQSPNREKNIRVAVLLNVSFTIIELIGGLLTNSVAILADALHDFGDSVALITAWVLERKAKKPADGKRTFGYARLSLLSAIISALVLVGGSLFILSQAISRLFSPEHASATGMIGLAVLGLALNSIGFLRLKRGSSANEKVLSWHLLDDVLGWGVILIGALIMRFWDTHYIDPIMTIGFVSFTLWGVTKNLRETFNIFLEGVPAHVDLQAIKHDVLALPGVTGFHDIHIWSLEGDTDILTGHVVISEERLRDSDTTRREIKALLAERHIEHSTLELESPGACSGDECDHGRAAAHRTLS
jgi:cobalt-zinc-cadmium efflux system protein